MQCDKCLNNKDNVCLAEWNMCSAQYEHCFGFENKETYEKGRADREKEICDFLKEIANGDDVNTKLLELIKEQKNEM